MGTPTSTPMSSQASPTPSKDLGRETAAAAEFWGAFVPEAQRDAFQCQLAQLLARDFHKHWYVNEPHRGSAFRSIKCDGYGIDRKLLTVVHSVGISSETTTFPPTVVMWVNPGEVKVRFEKYWSAKVIYTDAESPGRKEYHPLALKMQIEPTILCSDASDYYTSSDGSDSDSALDSPMPSPPTSPAMHLTSGMVPPQMLWRSGQDFVPHPFVADTRAHVYVR